MAIADATAPAIAFQPPAQVGPNVGSANATWAYISFQASPANHVSIDFSRPVRYDNLTQVTPVRGSGYPLDGPGPSVPASMPSRTIDGFAADARFPSEIGTLYLEGDSITFAAKASQGDLVSQDHCIYDLQTNDERSRREARTREMCPDAGVGVVLRPENGSIEFAVSGHGLRVVEWHHASVSCKAGNECPDGGVREEQTTGIGPQANTFAVHGFNRMESQEATISGSGQAVFFAVGSPALDLAVDGWIRLPAAHQVSECEACAAPSNQTFFAEGDLVLQDLHANPDGTMTAVLQGDIETARFDEVSVDPTLLTGQATAVVAATAAGLVVLKLLLAPLFTRLSKEQALEHPRRRAIFEHIQRNPGTSFRETARVVGIAAGTVRHHLNVLQRAGMVVERPYGATVRFFENHGKHDADWVEVVMLREPPLRLLFDWLKQHPQSPQTAVLEAMEGHGWSRSTTQHRLSRLVDAGLVNIRLQGRYKMYSVADRPPPSPGGRPNPMAAPAHSPS